MECKGEVNNVIFNRPVRDVFLDDVEVFRCQGNLDGPSAKVVLL